MRRVVVLAIFVALAIVAVAVSRRTAPEAVTGSASPSGAASAQASFPASAPASASASAPAPARPAVQVPVLPTRAAPSLGLASGWINSAPLGADQLAGKVVLYDFWTFECINCRHTFPWVEAWHERYAADGLVLASIHTPEFSFEADPANVAKAVKDDALTYPVALDPDRAIWRAYGNRYWPAIYVYDREGRLRYDHAGEGAYDETEDVLRALLGVDPASPRATVRSGR